MEGRFCQSIQLHLLENFVGVGEEKRVPHGMDNVGKAPCHLSFILSVSEWMPCSRMD